MTKVIHSRVVSTAQSGMVKMLFALVHDAMTAYGVAKMTYLIA